MTLFTTEGVIRSWVRMEERGICHIPVHSPSCLSTLATYPGRATEKINHSGDSDSTGSITGNLLGVQFGVGAIPQNWLKRLELREAIERLATDLNAIASGTLALPQAWDAYPGH